MKTELKQHLTDIRTDGSSAAARLSLPAEFVGFQGHFPDNPVLPGVCLVQAGVLMAQEALGKNLRLTRLKRAKFLSPVGVDDPITVSCETNDMQAKVAMTRGDECVAQFSLVLQEVDT